MGWIAQDVAMYLLKTEQGASASRRRSIDSGVCQVIVRGEDKRGEWGINGLISRRLCIGEVLLLLSALAASCQT